MLCQFMCGGPKLRIYNNQIERKDKGSVGTMQDFLGIQWTRTQDGIL